MRRYTAILFDLDGTLIDSSEDLVQSVLHGFEAIGLPPPERGTIVRNVGKPLIDFPALLGYDLTDRQRQEFTRYYRAYYAVHCGDHTEPFPGVRETLEVLREEGLKMAVVTTKSQDQAEGAVRTIGLARYFDLVRGWSPGQKMKPDPEPVCETLKQLGESSDKALVVGDSEQDILAAQAGGTDCCACLYGYRDPDFMRSLKPTYVITAFPEVRAIALSEAKPALA